MILEYELEQPQRHPVVFCSPVLAIEHINADRKRGVIYALTSVTVRIFDASTEDRRQVGYITVIPS